MLRTIIYGAGLYKLGLLVGLPLVHCYHQYMTNTEEWVKESQILRANKGSQVAVTGCTDGIGKDLALEFAKRGYQLLLFGRNPQKLAEVQAQAPGGLTHQIDYATSGVKEYKEIFSPEQTEVSIMVNNVGMGIERKPILEADP